MVATSSNVGVILLLYYLGFILHYGATCCVFLILFYFFALSFRFLCLYPKHTGHCTSLCCPVCFRLRPLFQTVDFLGEGKFLHSFIVHNIDHHSKKYNGDCPPEKTIDIQSPKIHKQRKL